MEEKDLKVIGFDDPNDLAEYDVTLSCFIEAVNNADAVFATRHAEVKKMEEITKQNEAASRYAYRIINSIYDKEREKGVPRKLLMMMQKYAKYKSNPSSDWLELMQSEFGFFSKVEGLNEWIKMVFHQLGFEWDGTLSDD